MTRANILALLVLVTASAAGEQPPSAYNTAQDAHIDCAMAYVHKGLRWNATASDLADAALASCHKELQAYISAIASDKVLRATVEQARDIAASHIATFRPGLIRLIVEQRNPPPAT